MDINRQKTGGRQKGTPNKITSELRESLKEILEDNITSVNKWIKETAKTDPGKAVDLWAKLADFAIPRLSRVETRDVTSVEDLLAMTPDERQKMIIKLQYELQDDDE